MSENSPVSARAADPRDDDADLDARIAAAERAVVERDARVQDGIQAVVAAGRQKAGSGLAIGGVIVLAIAGWLLLKALLPKRKAARRADAGSGDRRPAPTSTFVPYALGLVGPLVARALRGTSGASGASAGGTSPDWLLGLILPPLAGWWNHRKGRSESAGESAVTDQPAAPASEEKSPAPPPVHPVAQVDLMRYLGHWYEIARLPTPYERHCVSDVTATYARSSTPGLVSVVNACRQRNGKMRAAHGVAHVVKGSRNAKLKVSFAPALFRPLPLVWADYWILAIDDDYRHALVGTPDRRSLWILSRTPAMSITERERLVGLAREQGYATDRLIITEQGA